MEPETDRWQILLVSERDADPFRTALEATDGLRVRRVTSSSAARESFDATVDCVVCDHGDGDEGVDAVALLDWVRDRRPDCPFVLVADADATGVATAAVARDVSEFVTRDSPPELLVERVAAAIAETPTRDDAMRIDGLSTEAELRLKERAMDEAPVGITISDPDRPDNPLVYINDQFESVTGYSPEEMRGRNCRILQGEETDPAAVAEFREAIDAERPARIEIRNYRKDGTPFWNEVTLAPLRDETGEVTNFVGFQADVTARKEAERALEAERAALAHLLDRLDGLLQDVTSELVEAGSRDAVEQAVTGRLAALDAYSLAWVGRHDRVRDEIVPAATDGDAVGDEMLTVDVDAEGSPIASAYETRATQVATGGASLPDGVEGVVAVPLQYGETVYGVLGLWTTDADALTDHELAVLEALARMAATAINAIERGRIIGTDAVLELDVQITDDDLFLVALAAETGCEFSYAGAVSHDDGSMGLFFTSDASADQVERVVATHPGVAGVTCVRDGAESVYEFDVADGSLVALLARRGVKIRGIEVAADGARVRLDLPTEADAREVFDLVESRYPGSDLLRYQERERPPQTRQEFVDVLHDRLTDRQKSALTLAFVGGYYDPDRQVSGDELAEAMGLSRATFHQHRRAAERKLLEAVLDTTPQSS